MPNYLDFITSAMAHQMTENDIIDMVIEALLKIKAANDADEEVCRCCAVKKLGVLALKWELMDEESEELTAAEMIEEIREILG